MINVFWRSSHLSFLFKPLVATSAPGRSRVLCLPWGLPATPAMLIYRNHSKATTSRFIKPTTMVNSSLPQPLSQTPRICLRTLETRVRPKIYNHQKSKTMSTIVCSETPTGGGKFDSLQTLRTNVRTWVVASEETEAACSAGTSEPAAGF